MLLLGGMKNWKKNKENTPVLRFDTVSYSDNNPDNSHYSISKYLFDLNGSEREC